jgi:pantoate--beta-alanine ligase
MKIFEQIEPLVNYLSSFSNCNKIGFVPTMGALHQGHLNLIQQSKQDNQLTVCSIFINRIQFNNEQDFIKYPKTVELDIKLLCDAGCDCLFIPEQETVFPKEYVYKMYDLGSLETMLEGLHRPGHFQGVCNVVDRLIDIVQPDKLYLGLKDLQQCKVIEKMLALDQLNKSVDLVLCETIRNESGLALSSRNKRLSADGLIKALDLIKTLHFAKDQIKQSETKLDLNILSQTCIELILLDGFESVDYFSFLNQKFEPVESISKEFEPLYILTAATIEGVRLIDNTIV